MPTAVTPPLVTTIGLGATPPTSSRDGLTAEWANVSTKYYPRHTHVSTLYYPRHTHELPSRVQLPPRIFASNHRHAPRSCCSLSHLFDQFPLIFSRLQLNSLQFPPISSPSNALFPGEFSAMDYFQRKHHPKGLLAKASLNEE